MQDNPKLKELRQQAMRLPLTPGVYIMKNAHGDIIYIGKAKALKNRVSQYFGADTNHSEKVRQMVRHVDRFEYILVDSEFEALVLECSLIKQHQPKYNILLKDDKGYCYVRISPPPFARIHECKKQEKDGAKYLGPYLSAFVVKQSVDEACKAFSLATCGRSFTFGKPNGRPCLNHYIGQCCAPCTGKVREEDYAERVSEAVELLTAGASEMIAALTHRMEEAAENLAFEKAARLRDRIAAIRRLQAKQTVVQSPIPHQDVVALVQSGDKVCAEVFRFVGGQLVDREEFIFEPDGDMSATRSEFLRRYYSMRDGVPPRVTIDGDVEDADVFAAWLSEKAGRQVKLHRPQRGEQVRLLELCRQNAAEHLAKTLGVGGRESAALDELGRLLGLATPPAYIECYDISNQNGTDTVAGMVVYENGKPLKSAYRRFAIQTVVGQDDYAAMQEVLRRRFAEYEAHKSEGEGFGRLPDVIFLDGGEGHLHAGQQVLDELGVTVPLFGLVKDNRHRTRAITAHRGEIAIQSKRAVFTLLSDIQEEVHRFAIGYHRKKRKKSSIQTTLTAVPTIGAVRAKELLKRFGSLQAIREATAQELLTVKGMTQPAVDSLLAWFAEHP